MSTSNILLHYTVLQWLLTREFSYTTVTEVSQEFLTNRSTAQRWLDCMVRAQLMEKSRLCPNPTLIRRGHGREWYYMRTHLLVRQAQLADQVQNTAVLLKTQPQLLATPFNQPKS